MLIKWSRIRLELLPLKPLPRNGLHPYVALYSMLKWAKHDGVNVHGVNFRVEDKRINTSSYHVEEPLKLTIDLFPCSGVTVAGYCASVCHWLDQHEVSHFDRRCDPILEHCTLEFPGASPQADPLTACELDVRSPLPFRRAPGAPRTRLEPDELFGVVRKRAQHLFEMDFPPIPDTNGVSLQCHWWNYAEIRQQPWNNPGHVRYFKGCEGRLYLQGELTPFYPWLRLAEVVHGGGSYVANGLGACTLHIPPRPWLDRKLASRKRLARQIKEYSSRSADLSADRRAWMESELPTAESLAQSIASGKWHPGPMHRVEIEQGGKRREIVIPHPQSAVVSRAIHELLKSPLDRLTGDGVHGFRQGRGLDSADRRIRELMHNGYRHVARGDIADFFGSIDQSLLEKCLDAVLPPGDVRLRQLLIALVREGREPLDTTDSKGIPVGLPISPLLSNLFLRDFDRWFDHDQEQLVRYGDDFLLFARTRERASNALDQAGKLLDSAGLKLNVDKSGLYSADDGFDFLGRRYGGQDVLPEKNPALYRKPVIVTHYADLTANGAALQLRDSSNNRHVIPIHRIANIIIMGTARISTPLIQRLRKPGVPVVFCGYDGRHIATLVPDNRRWFDIAHRHASFHETLTDSEHCQVAKRLVAAKIQGYVAALKARKERGWGPTVARFNRALDSLEQAASLDTIRGVEGAAAREWFALIRGLIQPEHFRFERRDRLAEDPMNGLLNFSYHLLFTRLAALIRAAGVNPFLGHLHSDGNYEVLTADLMEPFRPAVDRWLVSIVNLRQITARDFKSPKFLNGEATARFARLFEDLLHDPAKTDNLIYLMHKQVFDYRGWVLGERGLTISPVVS